MIRVTQKEAMEIRKCFPELHVARTCKQHPRKSTYYATETPGVLQLLAELRKTERVSAWDGTDKFDGYQVKGE